MIIILVFNLLLTSCFAAFVFSNKVLSIQPAESLYSQNYYSPCSKFQCDGSGKKRSMTFKPLRMTSNQYNYRLNYYPGRNLSFNYVICFFRLYIPQTQIFCLCLLKCFFSKRLNLIFMKITKMIKLMVMKLKIPLTLINFCILL